MSSIKSLAALLRGETEQAAWVLWRYHNRPAEELYDVQDDPDETCNLAANPQYGKLMEKFRTQMVAWRHLNYHSGSSSGNRPFYGPRAQG